jgi:hypothetical protein
MEDKLYRTILAFIHKYYGMEEAMNPAYNIEELVGFIMTNVDFEGGEE